LVDWKYCKGAIYEPCWKCAVKGGYFLVGITASVEEIVGELWHQQ
jgi:hypothetical protein